MEHEETTTVTTAEGADNESVFDAAWDDGGGEVQTADPEDVGVAVPGDPPSDEQPADPEAVGAASLGRPDAETPEPEPVKEASPATPAAPAEKETTPDQAAPAVEPDNRYTALTQELETLGGMDTVREVMGLVQELAKNGGMTVEQTLDTLSAGIIVRRDNVGMDVAKERARAERLQKAGEDRRAREAAEKSRTDEAERRRNEDFAAFIKAYPKVEAKDIPAEVWAGVRQGQSLVTAYALYDAKAARAEADRLRAEAETARKNAENRQKAAPAGQTAGNAGSKTDPFDEGWDD